MRETGPQAGSTAPARPRPARRKRRARTLLAIYLLLLLASHLVQRDTGPLYIPPPEVLGAKAVTVPAYDRDRPAEGQTVTPRPESLTPTHASSGWV